MSRSLQGWTAPQGPYRPWTWALRACGAAVLKSASCALGEAAQRLGGPPARPAPRVPTVEFHADAGAPEGALYVDGELVARLPGVTRL